MNEEVEEEMEIAKELTTVNLYVITSFLAVTSVKSKFFGGTPLMRLFEHRSPFEYCIPT